MYSINQLRQVKGIGEKTIQRIIEQFDESDYVSEYDPSIHIEPNTLVHGDMLEVMNGIPDKSIDMILTDPPYGMDFRSGRRIIQYDKIENDKSLEWLPSFVKQINRVTKDNSAHYMFVSHHHIGTFMEELSKYFTIKNVLVWKKNNHSMGDLQASYAPITEFIIHFQKGRKFINGNRDNNVLEFNITNNELHPTQKPVDMLEYLIEKFSDEGDVVLDAFMGSGSTCVASKNTNRKYIGIELDEEYYNTARERLGE